MEDPKPSKKSPVISLAEMELPVGDSPKPHPPQFLDPAEAAEYFASLLPADFKLKNNPEGSRAWKESAEPFVW